MVRRRVRRAGALLAPLAFRAGALSTACDSGAEPMTAPAGRLDDTVSRTAAVAANTVVGGAGSNSPHTPGASCPQSPTAPEELRRGCPVGMARIDGGRLVLPDLGIDARIAAFCIDVRPVTAADYERCVDLGGCRSEYPSSVPARTIFPELCSWGKPDRCHYPMNCVTWDEAVAYCVHRGARLPVELEWRWAWQNGETRTAYPSGWRRLVPGEACLAENVDGPPWICPVFTHPKASSSSGITDLHGNVVEWVAGRGGGEHVYIDGGSGGSYSPLDSAVPYTGSATKFYRSFDTGFRCAADYRAGAESLVPR